MPKGTYKHHPNQGFQKGNTIASGRVLSEKHKKVFTMKGRKHTVATKLKISCSKKANPTRYWLGKHLSDRTKEKISVANKGKISPLKGEKLSEEHIEKLRLKLIGKIGEKANRWIKDRSLIKHQDRRDNPLYRFWRICVYKRDNYTCQKCGNKGGWDKTLEKRISIVAHHIKGWAKYPESRYDVENGMTLCLRCHYNIHYIKN